MKRVGVIALPGTRTFDIAVVSEVWGIDRTQYGLPRFELRICMPDGTPIRLSPLGALAPTHSLSGLSSCDLIVVPGRDDPSASVPENVIRALQRAHRRGTRIAALCSGAFTLAAAGLLDGRPATTHWGLLADLVQAAPLADVREDVLFVEDDDVCTSAGVAGGFDLCMHLIRQAHGEQAASTLARRLVMAPVRHGDQRQFADVRSMPKARSQPMSATLDWAAERLDQPIGVADLAGHAHFSERTFQRTFLAETGTTPGKWLLAKRIQLARRLLESADLTVDQIARSSGLGTAANLRRRLRDAVGLSPDAYRRSFRRVS